MPYLVHSPNSRPRKKVVEKTALKSDPKVVPDPVITILRNSISSADGKVLAPGEDTIPGDVLPFNLRTNILPRAIVRCKTPRAVGIAIRWALTHGIPLRAHGGGHSYEGFCSVRGLMIDVKPMNAITVDRAARRARIGAGATLEEVNKALFSKGFAIPAGTCGTVGISGLTMGGGHGLCSRKWGLTCDNLISARIVMADGNEITVSSTQNPDLFWAIRGGGGGNFGVVTEFVFNVHPVDKVLLVVLKWKPANASAAMGAWQRFMATAPDEFGSVMVVTGSSSAGISGARCSLLVLPRAGEQKPDKAAVLRQIKPLTDIPNLSVDTKEWTYQQVTDYFKDISPRVFFKAKSDYSPAEFTLAGRNDLLRALRAASRAVAVIFEAYGGAVNRLPVAGSAFPHRGSTRFCMQYYAEWGTAASNAGGVGAVRSVHAAMRAHLPGLCYVNYTDLDLGNGAKAYYGPNLRLLVQVKNQYDPRRVFDFDQAIPSAMP